MESQIHAISLEKFSTFGDFLRFLRRRAGITQMELSIAVGYSDAQISRLEQNLRLPDIPTLEARFVPALGLDHEPKLVARLLELAANVRREDAPGLGLCPYKGLSYFDESDSDLFVGREELTAKLVNRILSLTLSGSQNKTRFLAVVGASGSGKSSLLRAGVISSLRWNKRSADWHVHILTPTAHPIESLARALTSENTSVTTTAMLMDDMQRDPRSLHLFASRKDSKPSLVVIDQFEELFALCRLEEERVSFISNLLTAASEADAPVIMVITLRADFYAHCANYIQLREALAHHQEYIGAMSEAELRRAIEEPAQRGRWEFEPGLVDTLLHDVGHEPGALPLLSHALLETWQRRRGRMMTLSGYASSGGVRGAIAETAEAIFTDQLTPEQKAIARRIFLRLTELGDESSAADTRRRAKFDELILKPEETGITQAVLKALADARLIITSEDSAEVAHEALIREWPTLRTWLEENRDGLRLHRQLTESAQEWLDLNRSPDVLYRGARLAQVREWSVAHLDEMNTLECEFLEASIQAVEREAAEKEAQYQRELESAQKLAEIQRQRAELEAQRAEEQVQTTTQLRKRSIYLMGAFVVALIMAFTALFFGSQAREAAQMAQVQQQVATSRELAAASTNNLNIDPERSILLALQALDIRYTIEAEDALHRAVQSSHLKLVIPSYEPGTPMGVQYSLDGKYLLTDQWNGTSVKLWDAQTGTLVLTVEGYCGTLSPDGKRIATVRADHIVKLWNAATGREIQTSQQITSDFCVAFSPDGSRLAAVTSTSVPATWDSRTGRKLVTFQGHTDRVSFLSFSPDGKKLLSISDDGTARIWDSRSGKELLKLVHQGWVWHGAFNQDGTRAGTASGENGEEVFVWDAETGEKLLTLSGHTGAVFSIAFNADGTYIATGGEDRRAIIWDAATGRQLFILAGHTHSVVGLDFSPDGRQLATSSFDGTVRVWDLAPGHELLNIATSTNSYGHFAFAPDGTSLTATGANGQLTIWDLHSGQPGGTLPGPVEPINDIAYTPDGRLAISIAKDPKIKVWDTSTGNLKKTLSGHTSQINGIAINREGTRLVTVGGDYKAIVWEIASGTVSDTPLFVLEHSGVVTSAAFSPDGSRIIAGVNDGTASVWDTASKEEVFTLRGHDNTVNAVTFSPDGMRIGTASYDSTAKIWDARSGRELLTLRGHTNGVMSIAFSLDGSRIATASRDGTAKLWDTATGEELLTFFGDGSGLNEVAFSPDGKLLATGGDRGVQVYLLDIQDLIALARTRVTRTLTSDECERYLHLDSTVCAPVAAALSVTPLPVSDKDRVCQVADPEGLYDNYFNEMNFNGLQAASKQFDWDTEVLISFSRTDYDKNVQEFLQGDCELIVGLGLMSNAVEAAAKTDPNQRFLISDMVYDPPLENVWTHLYATDQAAFMAGYLAASMTQTGKVGVFGGIDIPPVTDFMDGFALGIAYYNEKKGTNVELIGWDIEKHQGSFIGGFCCVEDGIRLTEQLIDAGADIVFPVAGHAPEEGALQVAKRQGGIYIIGVDVDWALTQPEYRDIILTSILKNYDTSVVQAVAAIEDKTFTGGIHMGTLENNGVGLAPFHDLDDLIPVQIKEELEKIKADIIAGRIKTKP